MADIDIGVSVNVADAIETLKRLARALSVGEDAALALTDVFNNSLVKSGSKAAESIDKVAVASKKRAGTVVTSLQSEQKAAEQYEKALQRLDKKLQATERQKGERTTTFNARVANVIESTRGLPDRGVTTGGASSVLSPDSRDKVIQYQRAIESLAKTERDLAAERKKNAAEERLAAAEKLKNAQIAAVSQTFNLPAIAAGAGIQQYETDAKGVKTLTSAYKQLELDAVVVSKSLAGIRYALYDVSRTATVTGVALLAAVALPAKAAIDLDREFADVRRTTGSFGEEAAALKDQFIDLAQTLPIAFKELAKIGTLGGQLNVSNTSLTNFTANVAKFAATTDVSVTDSATAFGRLGELIDGVNGQYQKLGSAILKVGTESVATESQIINTAQQIAAIGNAAGFSASEVIALSGTLASLGTTPELSRGLVTRLFANINSAISLGGANLKEYDRLVASTGKTFTQLWQDDSSQALVEFFRGISFEGANAAKVLNDIGITSVRDVPAILRLSQNLELLEKLLADSSLAFETGIEINAQYGKIADTVAAKLERLGNNFSLLFASVGEGANIFGGLVDTVNNLVVGFTNLLRNPVAQGFFVIVGAFMATFGVISLLVGAFTKITTSVIAFKQVLLLLRTAMGLLKTETAAVAAETFIQGVAADKAALQNTALGRSMLGVAVSSEVLKTALRSLLIATAVGAVLVGIGFAVDAVGASMKTASQKAKDYFGDIGGLIDAVKADTKAFLETNEAIYATQVALSDSAKETFESRIAAQKLAGAYDDTKKAIYGVRQAAQDLAFGEASTQWFTDQFVSNEKIQQIASNPEIMAALQKVGFDFSKLIGLGMTGAGAGDYVQKAMNDLLNSGELSLPDYFAASTALTEYSNGVDNAINATEEWAQTNALAQSSLQDLGIEADLTDSDISDMVANVFAAPNKIRKMVSSLYALGESFAEGGASAIGLSDEMQTTIASIISVSGPASQAVANLTAFLAFLEANGYASAAAVQYLNNQIADLGGDAKGAVANIDFGAFVAGMKNAGKAAGGAARQVKTLADYASDLQGVFSRAFDIRFQSQLNADDIAQTWADLADGVKKAKAELDELNADKGVLEYFLSVAEAFGDTVRANRLRAQIAKVEGNIADATAESSTELEGNSQAAIANRARLAELVQQYQSYIVSLAASGASQGEIAAATARAKQQFLDQAVALGYSTEEVEVYTAAFDDMITVVNRIPRNITVTANTNPALQALNEFAAQASAAGSRAGNAFQDALDAALAALDINVNTVKISGSGGGGGGISLKFLKEGGYTGNGDVNQVAGVVHRGEYVMPAKVVGNYGRGFFDNLMQMRTPAYAVTQASAPSSMMVALSPEDRALLRGSGGSGDIVITVDSREIARASANGSKLVTAEGGYLNG